MDSGLLRAQPTPEKRGFLLSTTEEYRKSANGPRKARASERGGTVIKEKKNRCLEVFVQEEAPSYGWTKKPRERRPCRHQPWGKKKGPFFVGKKKNSTRGKKKANSKKKDYVAEPANVTVHPSWGGGRGGLGSRPGEKKGEKKGGKRTTKDRVSW